MRCNKKKVCEMKKLILLIGAVMACMAVSAKTLIVYYSYTNNTARNMSALGELIDADVVVVEPAEEGLDYAANNYAIGSSLIAKIRNAPNDASSYPAIKAVEVDLTQYDTIIIGAPLWWSQMAAPLQTFLFERGAEMGGKHIGLIVSSHSSSISGVESDAKRLIPNGIFMESLWIRSSQTSNARALISAWLEEVNYEGVTAVSSIGADERDVVYYDLQGRMVGLNNRRGILLMKNEK